MELKARLTTEKLRKEFTSQFELVNYAIKLAENMIKTGRDPRVKTDTQNRAMQVLEEISSGKDQFDEIPAEQPATAQEMKEHTKMDMGSYAHHEEGKKRSRHEGSFKSHAVKRGRNILVE